MGGVRTWIVGCGLTWIAAAACGEDTITPPSAGPDSQAVVASIRMRPTERLMGVLGTTIEVSALRVAKDGTGLGGSLIYPERFTWSSDTPAVARVDPFGVVRSVSEGTAIITATSDGVSGTTEVTVREAARLAWSLPLDDEADAGVGIGHDGMVFIGTNRRFFALDPGGSIRWSIPTVGGPEAAPAIAPDGTIYFGTGWDDEHPSLTAVDATGDTLWTRSGLGSVFASPSLGEDGTIYIVTGDSTVQAISPAGETEWTYKGAERFTFSSPAIAEDGTLYTGALDGRLYALNPDGTKKWISPPGDTIWASPSIAPDGTIYFTSFDGELHALDPDGQPRWSIALSPQEISSSPAIGSDGTIYVAVDGVHAVSPGGSLLWTSVPTRLMTSAPILAADGTIYVSGSDGRVYALNPDGSLKWDYLTGGPVAGSPAIGLDGMIFAASYDGSAYAFVEVGSTNGGYESAPWPTARGDRANTGRAGGL